MDIEDLKETAALAHLNLEEPELKAAFPAFEQMLAYFAAMQRADEDEKAFGASISELSSAGEPVESGHFRGDAGVTDAHDNLREALLGNSGEREQSFIVVPNVL
jgi:aspartyl-tRNA(Asn)/glutamyl-tRNA(Gln) amidotransferase subunit C